MAENDFIGGTQSEKVPYAIIVMLLGIFSIIACLFGGWPGLLVAGIGLFLASKGSSAYKASPDTYMASSYSNLKLGRILCWVGFVLSALVLIIGIMVMSSIGEEGIAAIRECQESTDDVNEQVACIMEILESLQGE